MNITSSLLLICFYLFMPALIIYLCYTFPSINKIGAVLLCYIAGITLGNIGILPEQAKSLQDLSSNIAIILGLPMLLFTINIKTWFRLAGKALLAFTLECIAVVIVVFAGYLLLRHIIPDAWKIAGMLLGVYTGGTPNLAAIKEALGVDSTTFVIVHTYDTVLSMIYIIFLVTIAQKLFLKFLPPFKVINNEEEKNAKTDEDIRLYGDIFSKNILKNLVIALLLSIAVVAISLGIAGLLPNQYQTMVVILAVTTIAILLSLIPYVHNLKRTFQFGMYLIYIFCTIVGSMVNVDNLIHINIPLLFYVFLAIFGSLLVHGILCKIFSIDTDTYIITSVAGICSPPFVPVVADALHNKYILLSGITTGVIGYAIGNYLGITLGYIFSSI
ncbi:MAG: DUF819 family protein [Spirochaetes bacterium]|nr:DUF819 family protein [Spirochaetota bacterium]